DEAQPRAPRNDRREHVDVRVADAVPGATAIGKYPQADRERKDEQPQQQPRALEAHRTLAQSAWTWTSARTPASSASPRTPTTTPRLPIASEPETLDTRLAFGG